MRRYEVDALLVSNRGSWGELLVTFRLINHYDDVILSTIASEITSLTIIY